LQAGRQPNPEEALVAPLTMRSGFNIIAKDSHSNWPPDVVSKSTNNKRLRLFSGSLAHRGPGCDGRRYTASDERLMMHHTRGFAALLLQALMVIPSALAWAQAPRGTAHFFTTLRGIHVAPAPSASDGAIGFAAAAIRTTRTRW
jgi:hypothetical protein